MQIGYYFEYLSTITLITVKNKVLDPINTVSKILQDFHKDIEMLSSLLRHFQNFRDCWNCIKKDAFKIL